MNNIAHYLDYANHHSNTTHEDVQKISKAVIQYSFNGVFINPLYISYAKELLDGQGKIGTVISFPLGQELLSIKISSVEKAAYAGADELDVSLNVGAIKEARWNIIEQEMKDIINAARLIRSDIIVKFIPETGYLTPFEIKKTAELMVHAGADFFKTCSGMGPRGSTIEDVTLVREAVGSAIKVKVAGGIRTYQQARAFIDAGANRIGTSRAVEIIQGSL